MLAFLSLYVIVRCVCYLIPCTAYFSLPSPLSFISSRLLSSSIVSSQLIFIPSLSSIIGYFSPLSLSVVVLSHRGVCSIEAEVAA